MVQEQRPPRATHKGILPVGALTIPVFVLEDGTRVITQRGIQTTVGMSTSGGSGGAHRTAQFVERLEAKLNETNSLSLRMRNPIVFFPPTGGVKAYGFEATTLIDFCDLLLRSRKGLEISNQEHLTKSAEIVITAFAKTGIIAVIDEVTGYQYQRDRDELQKILAAYISPVFLKYTSRFPEDFYREMFRLRNWQFSPLSVSKGPRFAGKLTNRLIYDKLPPGVLDDLRKKNPADENWQRKHKHYQLLTEDIGDPHLNKQVAVVTTLMRISPNWITFERHFSRAFPSPQLTLIEEDMEDEEEDWPRN